MEATDEPRERQPGRWPARTSRRTALAAFAALALIAGCGGGGDDPPPSAPPEPEKITYSRTGGIAGVGEFLAIEPTGEARLQVGFVEPASVKFRVSEERLDDLYGSFEDVGFPELESPDEETGCADCFTYEIALGTHRVEGDDVDFPAKLEPLLAELKQIVAAKTPPDQPSDA